MPVALIWQDSLKDFTMEREDNILPQDKDRHLDIPAEARQDNHINFLALEDDSDQDASNNKKDEALKERQQQWKEGLEEGKKLRDSE